MLFTSKRKKSNRRGRGKGGITVKAGWWRELARLETVQVNTAEHLAKGVNEIQNIHKFAKFHILSTTLKERKAKH